MKELLKPLIVSTLIFASFLLNGQESIFLKGYSSPMDSIHLIGVIHNNAEQRTLDSDHQLIYALSAKRLYEDRAEDLLMEQEKLLSDSYDLHLKRYALSNILFDKQEYSKAYDELRRLDPTFLTGSELEDYYFKSGYLALVNYQFKEASKEFNKALKVKSGKYKDPITYYRGMASYFDKDYETAVSDFKSLASSQEYGSYLPYYITQIYFTQGKYDDLINYGKNSLQDENVDNRYEIEKLIGQSYFKKGDFRNALIHFDIYEQNTPKLSKEEFYQMAITHYQLKNHERAIPLFTEISNQKGELGQHANYYLAISNLEKQDKQTAANAFKKAIDPNLNQVLSSAAKMNYAKIQYELGQDRLAIQTLTSFDQGSEKYTEAQNLLGEILIRSSDFATAMSTIEKIENKTPTLKKAYQRLAFKNALVSLSNENLINAKTFFVIAEENDSDPKLTLASKYWLANTYNKQGQLKESRQKLDDYFSQASKSSEHYFLAKYQSGYQYYQEDQTNDAAREFEDAFLSWNPRQAPIDLYYDAMMRAGDCYYMERSFKEAKTAFAKADKKENLKQDYAKFQLGNIEAAEGRKIESILIMEDLVDSYPNSYYSPYALYFNGENYLSLNRPTEALGQYLRIVNSNVTASEYYVPSLIKSALISYNAGDLKKAIYYYESVFKANANPTQKKEAINAIKEIYVEDLNDPDSYFDFAANKASINIDEFQKDSLSYSVGVSKFKVAEYQEAINAFDRYLKSYPNGNYQAGAYYHRGESYAQMKEYDIALENFIQLANDPTKNYYAASLKRALLISFNHKNDFVQSAEIGQKVLQLPLNDKEKKDFQEATLVSLFKIQDYSSLLTLSNQLLEQEALEDFELAKIYFYKGKSHKSLNEIDAAIAAFNKVVQNSKNALAAEASYQVAELFYLNKMIDKAESQALESTKRAANYPYWVAKSLLLLSEIYLDKKDALNARAAVEAVLENYTENEDIITSGQETLNKIKMFEQENNRVLEENTSSTIELDNGGN